MNRREDGTRPGPRGRTTTRGPHAPLAQALRVDRACAAFEDAWRQEQAPQIETYLEEFAVLGAERSLLLLELLVLELELRQGRGEAPSIGDYLGRFPDHAGIVAQAFRDMFGLAATGSHPARTEEGADRADPTGPAAAVRRLRAPGRAGAGRHGRGLPGPAGEPRSRGRAEDDPFRTVCLGGGDPAVPRRGRGRRPSRPSSHRPHLRGRPASGTCLLQHEADRRRQPGAAPASLSRRRRGHGPADGDRRPDDRARPPQGDDPPRPQTLEHPDRRVRPASHRRLRPGQAGRRRQQPDLFGRPAGHPCLHGPRAGFRRRGRARGRHLQPGSDPLPAPDGPSAIPGRDRGRDAGAGPRARSGGSPQAPPLDSPGARVHLPEVPGEEPRQALSLRGRAGRRSGTVPPGRGGSRRSGEPGQPPFPVGTGRARVRLPAGGAGPDPGPHPGELPDQPPTRTSRSISPRPRSSFSGCGPPSGSAGWGESSSAGSASGWSGSCWTWPC